MELIAQKREETGKKVKNLRYQGLLPAVIFGKGLESNNITINRNEFIKVYNEAGETTLIDIKIEGNGTEKVLVKDVTYNPVTDELSHVGFYKPNLKEKTSAYIPVELVGEEVNPLIKSGEAVAMVLIDEIEVEALPMDLPHKFEINVAELKEIGDHFLASQLSYDRSKVELVDLEEDTMIVKLDYAVQLETEEPEVSEEEALAGLEATSEKKPEEGEEEASKE